MKRMLGILLALVSTATLALGPGERAPDFSLSSMNSAPMRLSDYRGKVVYLDFWASWCEPCRESFPWMNELKQHYGSQGLEVLAINVDSWRDDAKAFLATNPAAFAVAFDDQGKASSLYRVKGMPSSYLIDRDGNILKVHVGFLESQKAQLEATIRQALGRGQ